MDTTTLYYFYELTKEMNMTKTAQRLFISQQTLSNHILRLENELGVKLFTRKPALALTYAGERTLLYAKTVLKEQSDFQDLITEITGDGKGLIRFGGSSFRLNACLPSVLPAFRREFPKVEIRLTDNKSATLEKMVLNNELDYALVLSDQDNPMLVSEPVLNDRVFLAVTDSLLARCYSEEDVMRIKACSKTGIHLKDLERLPFCMLQNHLGTDLQQCFLEENVTPNIAITSTLIEPSGWVAFSGTAAGFVCDMSFLNYRDSILADVNLLPVLFHGRQMVQQMKLIHNANLYASRHALRFAAMIQEYFAGMPRINAE